MYYSPTKLRQVYHKLRSKNKCPNKKVTKLASSTLGLVAAWVYQQSHMLEL